MELIEQTKTTFWERMIQDAVHEPDPVLSNLKITRCHYLLSCALQQVVGSEAGANFHSWAVWGSRKAGVTIRQEEREEVRRYGTIFGGIISGLLVLLTGWLLHIALPAPLLGAVILSGIACGAGVAWQIITWRRGVSAALILAGNRTVLEDIGIQTARFIETFHAHTEADPECLATFLEGLRPGDTGDGGQDLLRNAFTNYYTARFAPDTQTKQESAFVANCQAVLHEHIRLDPYIRGAMPWGIRRNVTRRLQFQIGPVRLSVAEDLPARGSVPFPISLQTLANTELQNFRTDSHTGAHDWTRFTERMRYIVHLFHAFHSDPIARYPPYDVTQLSAITASRIPSGPL